MNMKELQNILNDFCTPGEYAKLANISRATVQQRINNGKIKKVRISNIFVVRKPEKTGKDKSLDRPPAGYLK